MAYDPTAHLLDELRGDGAADEHGAFTVDVAAAHAKLDRFQLYAREYWVLGMVASAVASGADALHIERNRRGWEIRHNGTGFDATRLASLLTSSLALMHSSESMALHYLATAVSGLLADGAESVELEMVDPGLGIHLCFPRGGGQRMEPLAAGPPSFRLLARYPWLRTVLGPLAGYREELALVRAHCRYAPLALHFRHALEAPSFKPYRVLWLRRLVAPSDAPPGAHLRLTPPGASHGDERPAPGPFGAFLAVTPETSRLTIVVNGVSFQQKMRDPRLRFITCVAAVPALRLDLSGRVVVEDDVYRETIEQLARQARDMVVTMAQMPVQGVPVTRDGAALNATVSLRLRAPTLGGDASGPSGGGRMYAEMATADQEPAMRVFLEHERLLRKSADQETDREALLHAAARVLAVRQPVDSLVLPRLLGRLQQFYANAQGTPSRLSLSVLLDQLDSIIRNDYYLSIHNRQPDAARTAVDAPEPRIFSLLERLVDIRRRGLGARHPSLSRALRDLALLDIVNNNVGRALAALDEALAVEKAQPLEARRVGEARALLADIRGLALRLDGRTAEAGEAHVQAYGIRKRLASRVSSWTPARAEPASSGPSRADAVANGLARSRLMLGDVFVTQHRLDLAIERYGRSPSGAGLSPQMAADLTDAIIAVQLLRGDDAAVAEALVLALSQSPAHAEAALLTNTLRHAVGNIDKVRRKRDLREIARSVQDRHMQDLAGGGTPLSDECAQILSEGHATVHHGALVAASAIYERGLAQARERHGPFHTHTRIVASRCIDTLRRIGQWQQADSVLAGLRAIALIEGLRE